MTNKSLTPIVGAVPVLVMPFDDDGEIDQDSLHRQIDFCVEAGAQGIAFGTGSESTMLTDAERKKVWSLTAHHLNGKLPLIANTTQTSREGTLALTRLACDSGADCAMVNPHPRVGEHIIDLFQDLSDRIPISLMIQDAGGDAPAEILLKAAEEANQATCLKLESPGSAHKIGQVVSGLKMAGLSGMGSRKITVLGGANGNFLPEELDRGAVGTLPHPALIDAYRSVCDRYATGDTEGAQNNYLRLILPLLRLVAASGSSGGMVWLHKSIFKSAGILRTSFCRLDASPLPDWIMESIWKHLTNLDLCISRRLRK